MPLAYSAVISCQMVDTEHNSTDPTLRILYHQLTDEELLEAEQNPETYLEIVLRIYNRITSDQEEYKKFKELLAAEKDQRGN